jgi:hypothetical protein
MWPCREQARLAALAFAVIPRFGAGGAAPLRADLSDASPAGPLAISVALAASIVVKLDQHAARLLGAG